MRLHELRDRHRRAVQALDRSGCQLKGHPCFMRRQQIRIRRLFVSWGKTIQGVEVGDAQHEHSIRSNGLQVFDTGFHQLLADSMALIHRRHAARCEQVAFCVRMVLEDERRKQHVACNLPVPFDTDRDRVRVAEEVLGELSGYFALCFSKRQSVNFQDGIAFCVFLGSFQGSVANF